MNFDRKINDVEEQKISNPNRCTKFLFFISLNENICFHHVMSMYIISFVSICFMVYFSIFQIFILNVYVQVNQNEQGKLNGSLGFSGELVILFSSFIWGSLSDLIGRKYVVFMGFLLMIVALHFFPFSNNIFGVFVVRIVFSLGCSTFTSMSNALIGDYIKNEDKGKSSGILGITTGAGALTASFLLAKFPSFCSQFGVSERYSGWISNSLVVFGGIISFNFVLLLKSGKENQLSKSCSFKLIKKELKLMVEKPRIWLCYISSFVSRGDSISVNLFLTLWIVNEMQNKGYSNSDAIFRAGQITSVCQISAIIVSPFFGFLVDKLNNNLCLILSSFLSFISYLSLLFLNDITTGWIYFIVILIGIGEVITIISSQTLLTTFPTDVLGSNSGIFAIFGSIGVLINSQIGGILYDYSKYYPFVLIGSFNFLLFCFAFVFFFVQKTLNFVNNRKKNEISNFGLE